MTFLVKLCENQTLKGLLKPTFFKIAVLFASLVLSY